MIESTNPFEKNMIFDVPTPIIRPTNNTQSIDEEIKDSIDNMDSLDLSRADVSLS